MRKKSDRSVLEATDTWFLAHGLTYFVPERRASVRQALRLRRVVPLVLAVLLVGTGAGGALAWIADQVAVGPAALGTLLVLAAAWYALTALHVGPIARWALGQAFGGLRFLLPMTTRALPLLLLFITFLFINTEVWQVASNLTPGALWLVGLLFGGLAIGFLLVRLPEEVDRTDDHVTDELLLAACEGTPLEAAARELVDDETADPAAHAEVTGYERWNLVIALAIVQGVQVLLVTATVFVFLMVFGALTMTQPVMDAWLTAPTASLPHVDSLTVALLKVSVFLASFSGLYLTVSTVTDETYREQFFGNVTRQLERAVGMRAVYLALRNTDPSETF